MKKPVCAICKANHWPGEHHKWRKKAMTDAERARKYRLRNREKVLQRDRERKRRARKAET